MDFDKTNHPAVAGFLLPFVAAGVTGALVLMGGSEMADLRYSFVYLSLVPVLLIGGLISSLKSIPLIAERGDRDYAYSGLTLNVLFLCFYILSLSYFYSGIVDPPQGP